ncbi:DUF2971 domain-containing protein [Paraglaciecola psychrophila]|uniref:DUF2971 domain-containing protein n=1 Tax=Paraglaciecola psychrophila 170 TaxID=1129794 RepID=K6ZSQ3_9ALTE|nr:DUF2971 domain-containing protein [Paraglaciecola psychrophila]AGH42727.1 hypothetical protein C427_0617 [Paraglaciecola psychrophila 170]GAC38961.1 hypothetical protein GPSY_3350 [Paraglaciecola psychrophila 170]
MQLLYKYMSNPEYFLKDGYIRATQLSALNDPFEAIYCENALSELCPHFEICESPSELITHIETNKNKIGVISLTEAKDNLLMWSHYANEHKGAVIGFWSKSAFDGNMFTHLHEPQLNSTSMFEDYEMFRGECIPVMYRKQPRYRVDQFDFDYSNITAEGKDRIFFEIFQQKSDEWIYEKEHRVTLRLDQADKVIVNDIHRLKNKFVLNKLLELGIEDDNGQYTIYLDQISDKDRREAYANNLVELSSDPSSLYLFKVGAVKSIIYGLNVSESMIESYQQYIENYRHMEQWKASLNKDFYTLKFDEIELT